MRLKQSLLTHHRVGEERNGDTVTSGRIDYLLSRQKEHLKFHKLCRRIVSKITVISSWMAEAVPLDRYVGCIVTAACLLGRGIHGCPTELEWLQDIQDHLTRKRVMDAVGWEVEYSSRMSLWIMIHSMVLRIRTPPEHQLSLLGIRNRTPLEQHSMLGTGGLFQPPSLSTIHTIRTFLQTLTSFDINFRINDFGPLGPGRGFRGRDNFRIVTLKIPQTIDLLRQYHEGLFQASRESQEVLLKILWDVQREAFKSRPMTVAPPLVYLSK